MTERARRRGRTRRPWRCQQQWSLTGHVRCGLLGAGCPATAPRRCSGAEARRGGHATAAAGLWSRPCHWPRQRRSASGTGTRHWHDVTYCFRCDVIVCCAQPVPRFARQSIDHIYHLKHMGLSPNNSVNGLIGASKIKHVKMALRYTYLLGRRHCRALISTSSVVNCLHDQHCESKSSAISTSPQTPNESIWGYRPSLRWPSF